MKRPIIGITGNFSGTDCCVAEAYYLSVTHAGAVSFIIPPLMDADDEQLERVLDGIDALMLSGGADINPLLLGEEPQCELHGINPRRDAFELRLTRRAFERQMPILGICRGIQVLAAALGGTVIQDIYNRYNKGTGLLACDDGRDGDIFFANAQATTADVHNPDARIVSSNPKVTVIKHSQDAERWCATHTIAITENSILHDMFGSRLSVNSFHHQAVGNPGHHLRVTATSPDGIIEAVENTESKSIIGVQWHPESFETVGDHVMMPLFRWLAGEAAEYRHAIDLHRQFLTLDSHEDTPMLFSHNIDFGIRDPHILVNLPNMDDGYLDAGIEVAYLPQEELTREAHIEATRKANELLDGIERMVQPLGDRIAMARTPKDLRDNKRKGLHSIMLGLENGYAFGEDLHNVELFRCRGVVYCTLCHNGNNLICDSARPKYDDRSWGGLSPFGRDVVREMNRTGMMIDLSHAAESTFYDVLEASEMPVVCSHSNARALCDHPRNLTDDQLHAIAAKGGVVQVTLYDGFLKQNNAASRQPDGELSCGGACIEDVMRHLDHMVAVMGVEHVGIGSDFDGDGGIPGLAHAGELLNFTRALLRRRYSADDIALIWGGNFLRVMEQCQR